MPAGLQCFNESGYITLDVTDSITSLVWEGVIPFPTSGRTGSNAVVVNTPVITITSDAFLNGTPFVVSQDCNIFEASGNLNTQHPLNSQVVWKMTGATTMELYYSILQMPNSTLPNVYPALDIPVMVGVY